MSEFKVIETQEQFDAAISERINREKATLAKKYEGYISPDDMNAKLTESQTKIDDLTGQLTAANEKITNHTTEIAERDAKIKQYEAAQTKAKIAHEAGLSYEAIDFLKGENEEEIKKSAETLKGLIGTKKVPPLANTEDEKGAKDAALRETVRNLTKGD